MMKRLQGLLIGLSLALVLGGGSLYAAGITRISFGSALPTNCVSGDIFIKTSATAGLYWCSTAGTPGTWSAVGSGGSGTVTPTGTPASGNLAKFSGATSITNGDLSGDVTTSGTLATTLANSGVTATTYGDASHVGQFTVDAKGRITSASSVSISAAVGGLVQLAQIVTSGSQSTVDFSSISASYNSLYVTYITQDTQTGTSSASLRVRLNNDSTAANYTSTFRVGASNAVSVVNALAASTGGVVVGLNPQTGNTNIAATGEVLIVNYAGTTWHKRVMALTGVDDGTSNGTLWQATARWKSTSAVNRITFTTDGTAFTNGSVFTLYGVQ